MVTVKAPLTPPGQPAAGSWSQSRSSFSGRAKRGWLSPCDCSHDSHPSQHKTPKVLSSCKAHAAMDLFSAVSPCVAANTPNHEEFIAGIEASLE